MTQDMDRAARLLRDAALDPPDPGLRMRILGGEPRASVATWPAVAAAAFLLVLLFWVVRADRPPSRDLAAPQDEPARLIKQLGDPDPAVREKAASQLLKLGEKVRPGLVEAARSDDPETKAQATELLAKLDRIARLARIDQVCGRLGDTRVIWAENKGLEFLGDEASLLDWMKPALVESDEPAIVLVMADDKCVSYSEVVYIPSTVHGRRYSETSTWNAHPGRSLAFAHRDGEAPGAAFFRTWPGAKKVSFVFVSPEPGDDLLKGLDLALTHERADVRAAATHALQHYFYPSTGPKARKMLDDKSPLVRDAARRTLRMVVGAPDEGTAAWWDALSDEKRAQLTKERYDAEPWESDACCDTIFGK